MYVNLSKKTITENILPYLTQFKKGRKPKVALWRIVKAIIYRLKTGTQWRNYLSNNFLAEPQLAGIQSITTIINGQSWKAGRIYGHIIYLRIVLI
ncbi:transposase [Bernardetia sp. Wsw4-3y2]|uniref:transposase n=1 Tax=Bernardetia sp. Wsw4-3y2 TaxID=3127471 RepID=UPI0030D13A02